MAVMIPSIISPDIKSTAEKRIFKWLSCASGTEDWIVLHSLGIVNHNHVIYGEADFVVLIPQYGIFSLEVKGGRVKRTNGMWEFENRYNQVTRKSKGPFDQSREEIFNIIATLKQRLDVQHDYLKGIMFGYGVMFPDIGYQSSDVDERQAQIFDIRDQANVKEYIVRLADDAIGRWHAVYGLDKKYYLPTIEDVRYLANILRGDFDRAVSLCTRLKNTDEELISLTREQYGCLDQLDDNKRCVIKGCAGTGKTLLAVEETKKAVAQGKKTALFCFNSNLASWLQDTVGNLSENLRPSFVGTFHKYMLNVANVDKIPLSNEDEYFQNTLPEVVRSILLKSDDKFDEIIIDEAQDLIKKEYLKVMDLSLKRGLSRGEWSMFGDFSMQAIYSENVTEDEFLEQIEAYSSFAQYKLTMNCRNTKQICGEIELLTGFTAPKKEWALVDGMPVNYITYSSMDEESEKLKTLLHQLEEENIPANNITVLSPKKREKSVLSLFDETDIPNFSASQKERTTFSTIQAFKGLDNTIIILTDIEKYDMEKLLYVGLSRARSGLYIFETKEADQEKNMMWLRRHSNAGRT
jgi:hypothetical protein